MAEMGIAVMQRFFIPSQSRSPRPLTVLSNICISLIASGWKVSRPCRPRPLGRVTLGPDVESGGTYPHKWGMFPHFFYYVKHKQIWWYFLRIFFLKSYSPSVPILNFLIMGIHRISNSSLEFQWQGKPLCIIIWPSIYDLEFGKTSILEPWVFP